MKAMGLFGLMIPEEYGGLGESLLTYALVVEEIARGWMSVSGIINTHFIVAYLLKQHGTDEQKQRCCRGWPTGEVRGSFSMSEPGCGSDVPRHHDPGRARRRRLRDHRPEDVDHQRRHVEPAGRAGATDEGVRPSQPHQKMTTFLVEKEPGFGEVAPGLTIPGKIEKMGYKGVDSTEAVFDGLRVPATESSAASRARASTR